MNNLHLKSLEELKSVYRNITPVHSTDNLWQTLEYRLLPHPDARPSAFPRFRFLNAAFAAVFLATVWTIAQTQYGDFLYPVKSAAMTAARKVLEFTPFAASLRRSSGGTQWLNPVGFPVPWADPHSLETTGEAVAPEIINNEQGNPSGEPEWFNPVFGIPPGHDATRPGNLNPGRPDATGNEKEQKPKENPSNR